MIIRKMHASFGTLNAELTLSEGMNMLTMPNEAGKSTWSAFLITMLYGIDMNERPSSSNGRLPAKDRYRPWDGRSMQGRIDLVHDGRNITIERRTLGRTPMGDFAAYDTDTAAPIEGLTGENCGRILCGVERSVFERTAFIRQLGLSVSEDAELEKRMSALVTTGEEGMSATQLLQELHDRKVKLSRAVTGRIPKIKARLASLQTRLAETKQLQEEALQVQAQKETAQKEYEHYQALSERIDRAKNARRYVTVQELMGKKTEQEIVCKRLREQAAQLPSENELRAIEQRLNQANSTLQTAQLEQAFASEPPRKPTAPICFADMSAEQVKQQHAGDLRLYEEISKMKPPKKLLLYMTAVAVPLSSLLLFVNRLVGIGAVALSVALFLFAFAYYNRRKNVQYEASFLQRQILNRYGVDEIGKTEQIKQSYLDSLAEYETLLAEYEGKHGEREIGLATAQEELEAVLQQVCEFAPNCTTADEAKDAIHAALSVHSMSLSEERTLELHRSQLESMEGFVDATVQYTPDPEALRLDEARVLYEKNGAQQRVRELSMRLSEYQGKLSAMSEETELQAQLDACEQELLEALQAERVVDIAIEAVKKADENLRARFSPQITSEAAKLLSAMTEGKYANLLIKPDMQLSVRESNDPVMHPAAAMSCGTADQMYLAVRLAMVHRLLPSDTPILLDDALVNFDDARTAAALALLKQENRQIIFFTCKEMPNVL